VCGGGAGRLAMTLRAERERPAHTKHVGTTAPDAAPACVDRGPRLQAATIEHARLLDLLEGLSRRGDGSTDEDTSSDEIGPSRFELIDLLDRHYVRLCRAIGRAAAPTVERDLHELRVAHEWARSFEPISSVRMIIERHIERCPLEVRSARAEQN
jgi:hypothetical protein